MVLIRSRCWPNTPISNTKGPVIIYVCVCVWGGGGGEGVGGRNHGGGAGPIFSKTKGGPKENFTMIGSGSLCDCEE